MGKEPLYISELEDISADRIVEQGAYDVGGELRQARRRKGVDLVTAARDLKIRDDYLKALERNDHSALPGLPYAAGFVRSYANYVGLDAEDLVRRFKGETKKLQVKHEFTWLTPIQEGRYSGGLIFVLSLVLAGAAYAGWFYQTVDERKPAVSADAVLKQPATPVIAAAAGAAREVPKTVRLDRDAARRAGVGDAADATTKAQADKQRGDGARQGDAEKKKPGTAKEQPRLDTGADAMEVSIGEDQKPAQQTAVVDQTVTLKARGLVWLRVRNSLTRRVIAERVMKKGDLFKLPQDASLVLDVGRASQIEILVGGKSAGLAGPTVRPRHNVSLDPAKLMQAADPTQGRALAIATLQTVASLPAGS